MERKEFRFWIKACMSILLSALFLNPNSVAAHSLLVNSSSELNSPTLEHDRLDSSTLNELAEELEELKAVDSFEVEMKWTDLNDDRELGKALFLVDKKEGNMKADIEFQLENYYPQKAKFELLSYGRHRLLYIKEFALLESLAYFKQAYFDYEFNNVMDAYKKYYTEFSLKDIERINLVENPTQSLLFLPNSDKLRQVKNGLLTEEEGHYQLKIERMAIPSLFFEKQSFFSFGYHLDHSIQRPSNTMRDYQDWESQFNHQLKLDEEATNFLIDLNIESDFSKKTIESSESQYRTPQFKKELFLSSKGLTDKITRFDLDYQPKQKKLNLILEGIVEDVAFNFFSRETAELATRPVRLEYSFKAKEVNIPKQESIAKISSAQSNYLMDKVLTHPKVKD